MTIQKFETSLRFLSNIIFSSKFQFAHNKQSSKTFAHVVTSHFDFPKINVICFNALQIIVNILLILFDNVIIKFMTIVRNEMIDVLIKINFSYVECLLI